MVTKPAAEKKQWSRPELIRLGRIADVAGTQGVGVEGIGHIRS